MALSEHQMIFQLTAQLGGGFGGSFGKAQANIAALQKEIVALNKSQGDIAAYQKQQQAVERTGSKLSMLQQQYDNIQREISETGTFSSDLENKLLAKQQQIDKTSASLERETQKLNEMGDALREAGINTDDLAGESERLGQKIDSLREEQEGAADSAESFGDTASKAFQTAGEALAAAGIVAGLEELAAAYLECVNLAADYAEIVSAVEAISGASAEEIAMLSAKAKELGASTKYTAQESAEAMTYMAMAGWDATQMLSGMDGVMALAAASGEDLASVSDIVTDSLTAFGLAAEDTSHFADVLAAAATNSNTSVAIMGETFKNCAPVAGALGYSIEDVSVAVGLMANAGIKGSNAGTALRNTFTGLLSGVTLTSAAFGELEYSAVNADGTMKDFSQVVNELRIYFEQMSGAEQVTNAQAIAGQRAFAGFLSILNATDEDYAKLADSIENCTGKAQEMADTRMDNLRGDLTKLNSAWDALKVTIGESFAPEMREVVQIGTQLTSWINELAAAHPGLVKGILTFVGAFAAATAAILGVVTVIKVIIPLFKALSAAILGIPGVGPILAIAAGVAALAGVMVGTSTATEKEVSELQKLTEASAELNSSLRESVSSSRDAGAEIAKEEGLAQRLSDRLGELSSETNHTTASQEEMKALIDELNSMLPGLNLSFEDASSGAIDFGEALDRAIAAQYKLEQYNAARSDMGDMYGKIAQAEGTLEELTIRRAEAQDRLNAAKEAWNKYSSAKSIEDTTGYWAFTDEAVRMANEVTQAQNDVRALDTAIEDTTTTLDDARVEYGRLSEIVTEYADETKEAADASDAVMDPINATVEAAQKLAEAYTETYNAALQSIQGQFAIWDEAAEVVGKDVGSMTGALESQAQYWSDYNANLQNLAARTGDVEGLSDVIASFADGSKDSVAAIAGMADASDEELARMVASWQEVQAQQQEAAAAIADLETNFTASMEQMASQLESSVSGMDASGEAAASAQATIQSFINGAQGMLPAVQEAFASIGAAAGSALGVSVSIPRFASGTKNAPEGYALVGEEGPELVYLQGGEKIMNAPETRALMALQSEAAKYNGITEVVGMMPNVLSALASRSDRGDGALPRIQVVFQIEGNATPETVEALSRYGDEFAEKVLAVIDEARQDAGRRLY